MSLQLIAKQMEAKGRKGDSMLVHMTPGEVAGLQKLAESAGGSLSVNPETGLVEANFLKRMLPTLVGLGVGMVGGPMAGAAAGALVGGATAPKDQREMGILMGALGGYGGAGIGAGLGAAGSTAAQATAMGAEAARQGVQQTVAQTAQQAAIAEGAKLAGAEAAQTTAQQLAAEKLAQEAAADMARREAGAVAINQAGETAATDFAAQGIGARAGQGIQALAGQPGRDAFLGQVGMKTAGMAAAPLMMEDRKQAEVPVDDEMYSYTFDPGRTNVERTPSATSSEREYFRSSYSPMRKIRASEYGFAKGGEATTTDGATGEMSGASKAAFDYLMGTASSSTAGLPALAAQTQNTPAQVPVVGSDNMYAFDPASGTFIRNPNYIDPTSGARNPGLIGQLLSGGRDGGYDATMSQQTIDFLDNETPAERDARMEKVSSIIGFAMPGGIVSKGISSLFGSTPQAPAPVDTRLGMAESGGGGGDGGDGGRGVGGGNPDPGGYAGYDSGRPDFAAGGILGLAKGGMASGGFVVPADVVSALGNGSTDAGLRKLNAMMGDVKPIKGKGDGLSDSIPTNIDGTQRAKVADGEAYIDPKTVKRLGGAKKLYAMMDKVRAQAHGKTSQQRKVNPAKVLA